MPAFPFITSKWLWWNFKRMNRKYTTKKYKEAVDLLRSYFPDVNFTTDVIVGFPGETEEEFNTTYKFLEEIKFYRMHVFKYSKEEEQ